MLNHSFIPITWLGFFFAFAVWPMQPMLASSKNPADEHVKLELVSEQNAVVPGKELWLGIRFDLQDGWHTYWTNPGTLVKLRVSSGACRRDLKQERFSGPTLSVWLRPLLRITDMSIR